MVDAVNWSSLVPGYNDPSIVQTGNGAQVNAPVVTVTPEANDFKNLDPKLVDAFTKADDAWYQKTGNHLPVTSAARTREQQKDLFNRYKKGDKNVYMPINPDDHPEKDMFHTNAVDIDQSVPTDFLQQYGLTRPLGKADPVHTTLIGETKQTPVNPSTTSESGIDWAGLASAPPQVNQVSPQLKQLGITTPIDTGGTAAFVEGLKTGLMGTGVGAMQLGSNLFGNQNAASQLTGQWANQLEAANQPYAQAHPGANLMGRIVGATPFAAAPIGEIEAGASIPAIMKQGFTGGAFAGAIGDVKDAQNASDYWTKKLGQTFEGALVGSALAPASYGASYLLGSSLNAGVNAVNWIKNKLGPEITPSSNISIPAVEAAEKGGLSTDAQKVIAEAPQQVQQKVIQDVREGRQLDEPAIVLHSKDQALPQPLGLTPGQSTGNPYIIGQEYNNSVKNGFQQIQSKQKMAARENLDHFRKEISPMVEDDTPLTTGQKQLEGISAKQKEIQKNISSAYKELADANQGNIPLNLGTLKTNVENALKEKGATRLVSDDVKKTMKDVYKEGKLSFNQFETLRDVLNDDIKFGGKNAIAAKMIKNELENLPMGEEFAALKKTADNARSLSRQEHLMTEPTIGSGSHEKPNPDYNPIYAKYKSGKLTPENFNAKEIIGGTNAQLSQYVNLIKDNPEAMQNMQAGVINHLRAEATKSGEFSAKNYNAILNKLDATKKLDIIFQPSITKNMTQNEINAANQQSANFIKKLKDFGEVSKAAFTTPAEAHINRSGTKQAIEQMLTGGEGESQKANLLTGAADILTGVPIFKTLHQAGANYEKKLLAAGEAEQKKKMTEFGAGMSDKTKAQKYLKELLPRKAAKAATYGVGANIIPLDETFLNKLANPQGQ